MAHSSNSYVENTNLVQKARVEKVVGPNHEHLVTTLQGLGIWAEGTVHTFRKITGSAQSRSESHTFQRRKMNQQATGQAYPWRYLEEHRALSHDSRVGGDRVDFRAVWEVQVTRPKRKT